MRGVSSHGRALSFLGGDQMHLRLVFVLAAAAMLSACDQAATPTPVVPAEAPKKQSAPAADTAGVDKAGTFKLKTGERLERSEFGWVQPLGKAAATLLTVEFSSSEDPDLREASRRELVVEHLLPTAVHDGKRAARLWEKQQKISMGPLHAATNEEWMFERGEARQWRQTAGPKIDWSIITQDLVADPELSLMVPAKFIQKKWDSGAYQLEMHTVAFPGLLPQEAMKGVVDLLAKTLNCDSGAGRQPSYLADEKLKAVMVYAYPEQRHDLLDIVPFVHFDLARTDGRWVCDRQSLLDAVGTVDWRGVKTWDDIIR